MKLRIVDVYDEVRNKTNILNISILFNKISKTRVNCVQRNKTTGSLIFNIFYFSEKIVLEENSNHIDGSLITGSFWAKVQP